MSNSLLLMLILVPLLGAAFALSAKEDKNYAIGNVYYVAIWTLLINNILILYTFSKMDIAKSGIQMVEKYPWFNLPATDILLGVDTFSLLLLLGINLSFFAAELCIEHSTERPRTLIAAELLFIGLLNGYLVAADIISFYVFFTALIAPLIILISTYGNIRKRNVLIRFSLYNIIGVMLLFVSIMLICGYKKANIPLNTVGNINLNGKIEYFVWLSILFAFISRLPVWPFHYWISSMTATLRNPLVFVVGNLIPLVGLYGFIRFWPNTVPNSIAEYAPFFEGAGILTMLFLSLVSLSHKDLRYKLFAYASVYYLLFFTGVFLPTGILKVNIGYSLFAYIMIITVLSFLIHHIENQKKKLNLYAGGGILCYMPRTSKCLSLFVLAGIGLPITPLFWNNFIIISEIFNYSLVLGILVMLSLFIVALSLLEELYRMKDKSYAEAACVLGVDLPTFDFTVYMSCLIILFFSFFKPLWFVF
ncbi:MAG: hypothetical protein NC218_10765 [Acetobacter sp.]|nr:hypothetical protein [Acetobacter sp.]